MDHTQILRNAAGRQRQGLTGTPECALALEAAADEIERLREELAHARMTNEMLEKASTHYRWLCDNVTEVPLNPSGFSSDICPDTRLKWELPTLVSTTCVGGMVSFDEAIVLAMATADKAAHSG